MKCPLIYRFNFFPDHSIDDSASECLKEECACWDSELGRCDPTGLIRPLIRLVEALEEIERHMPHELQFRK